MVRLQSTGSFCQTRLARRPRPAMVTISTARAATARNPVASRPIVSASSTVSNAHPLANAAVAKTVKGLVRIQLNPFKTLHLIILNH